VMAVMGRGAGDAMSIKFLKVKSSPAVSFYLL
jgi:hypothetical protein